MIEHCPRTIADVLHGVHDKRDKTKRRPRPTNNRVWASIVHSPQRVIDDAFSQALAVGAQAYSPRARGTLRPEHEFG